MREIIYIPGERRWDYRALLLLADPEEQAIRRYLGESDMYVLRVDGRDVCEAVVRAEGDECELMNLATCEELQGRGYAGELVRRLQDMYAQRCSSMLVGTSEDGRGFYRRLGFQDAFVRKRFFVEQYEEPIMENGRRCVDMYCLRMKMRRKGLMNTYCNSAAEILRMAGEKPVFARALERAIQEDAYWKKAFTDDVARLSGWAHNFVCPECAGHMIMDRSAYRPGEEYTCGNCGRKVAGQKLDEAWVYYYRYQAAHELLSSALNFHVYGDQSSLEYIVRFIDFYADRYEQFPVHGDYAGKGKIMGQSLDEAVWALAVLRALYVCGRDKFPADKRAAWMRKLFRPLAELIQSQAAFIHNIPLWLQSASAIIAIFFEDDALLESALESEYGVRNQAKKGYTADGLWYECSMGYHYYATQALSEFLCIYHQYKPDDELFELQRKAYAVPESLSYDGWNRPAINDGWYPNTIAGACGQLIYVHRINPSAAIGAQIRRIWEREPERFETVYALLYLNDDVSKYEAPAKEDVTLYPDTCLAVMNKPMHVILRSGVLSISHMHPDCMTIFLAPFAEDIGTPGYGHPLTKSYYRSTLCHNTFVMDGVSQPFRPVVGSVYGVPGGVQAHADNVYDGVSCTRTLTEQGGVLHDVMHIEADAEHQFDWVFRSGGAAKLPEGGAEAQFPGNEPSYEYLSNIRRYEGAEAFEASYEMNGKTLTVRISSKTLRKVDVYTAEMPDNPADRRLTAVLLRTKGSDVVIEASYEIK